MGFCVLNYKDNDEETMEVGTGLVLLGGAGLVGKILGPTADYIGDGIKAWTQKRVHNFQNIFNKAARKLGDKIGEGGQVPPKVLKHILDDGSFSFNFQHFG